MPGAGTRGQALFVLCKMLYSLVSSGLVRSPDRSPPLAGRFKCANVSRSRIRDVDLVADGSSVWRLVIRTENL
jgi:hypothetical protein